MARDASGRGKNRIPREKRQYARQEAACSGRFLTHREITIQRGFPEDGVSPNALDDPNVYKGPLPTKVNFGQGA